MFSVLIEGALITTPVQRTSSKGSPFTTAQMCASDDGEIVWCSVIAFSTSAAEALAAVAVQPAFGTIEVKPREFMPGLEGMGQPSILYPLPEDKP